MLFKYIIEEFREYVSTFCLQGYLFKSPGPSVYIEFSFFLLIFRSKKFIMFFSINNFLGSEY